MSVETALEAQEKAMNDLISLMSGSVEGTEAEFRSLLTELLNANSGPNNPVESITS